MVDQMGEYLKETQKNTNISLPDSLYEILKTAPEQVNAPQELVEWIKHVIIEEKRSHFASNSDSNVPCYYIPELLRTIAIRNYYSPIQYQKAYERASLELSNRTYGRRINAKYQKLTN